MTTFTHATNESRSGNGCGTAAAPSTASQTASVSHAPSEQVEGISMDEAVDLARRAMEQAGEEWDVVRVESGPVSRVTPGWGASDWGQDLPADRQVWRVVLQSGDLSAEVVLDLLDGMVHGTTIGIAN